MAPHRIGRLTVEASISDSDTALALRPRLEALSRDALPALIEQLADALGLGEQVLRIDRLDLDLGTVQPERLEAAILEAIEHRLPGMLRDALHRARNSGDGARLLATNDAERDALLGFLFSGVAPPHAGRDFDPASRLLALQTTDPDAFASLIKQAVQTDAGRARLAALGHGAMPEGVARQPQTDPVHPVYIANAGLVLASPFLPVLFDRLGVLSDSGDGPRIAGFEAASRAVHLLEYLVTGRLDTPEPALALNKLLAGLPLATAIAPSIAASPSDLATCDSLLKAMIANWRAIAQTSIAGLRETFLQREGRLAYREDRWELAVQRKSLDVLVDQVPWAFSTVYHRWMRFPIHVSW